MHFYLLRYERVTQKLLCQNVSVLFASVSSEQKPVAIASSRQSIKNLLRSGIKTTWSGSEKQSWHLSFTQGTNPVFLGPAATTPASVQDLYYTSPCTIVREVGEWSSLFKSEGKKENCLIWSPGNESGNNIFLTWNEKRHYPPVCAEGCLKKLSIFPRVK